MSEKFYLSIRELQEYLGIGRTALYQLRLDRKHRDDASFAPEYEINGRVKFRRDEIDAWVSSRKTAVGRRTGGAGTIAPKLHPEA